MSDFTVRKADILIAKLRRFQGENTNTACRSDYRYQAVFLVLSLEVLILLLLQRMSQKIESRKSGPYQQSQ